MLDNINEQTKRILLILALAKCAVPLNYISLHTGIKDPLKILEGMEKKELIQRFSFSGWSSSFGPMFEITPKARKELFAVDLAYANKSVFSDYCLE
jgi:hypothetical protein